jgi:DNA-binding response OmpR family regulator
MPEKILIVDDDLDTLRLVGMMLQKQGYQIVAASSGPQGLELAFNELPDLILLDVMMPMMDGYEVARRLRANEKTANTPILMFTAKSQLDDKVTGFEAGADDYLTKPTHPTELQAHVKALLARSNKGKGGGINPVTGPAIEQPAYVIGVIAARGGLGVTTVASNLAASLRKKTNLEVILAEFRPGLGALALDMNLSQPDGLAALLKMPPGEITRDAIRQQLSQHGASGIDILAASVQPRDGILINNVQQFEVILSRLTFMARYVVVDLGCGITPLNQKLLPSMSEILVIAEPFANSLQHGQNLLDNMVELNVDRTRLRVVANYRLRSEAQLSVPQVQERIKYPIEVTFTPVPELLLQAIRMQTLAVLVQQDSLTTQQYTALAGKIETRAPKPVQK